MIPWVIFVMRWRVVQNGVGLGMNYFLEFYKDESLGNLVSH